MIYSLVLDKEIEPSIEISGGVDVTGYIRFGPEVTIEINGRNLLTFKRDFKRFLHKHTSIKIVCRLVKMIIPNTGQERK